MTTASNAAASEPQKLVAAPENITPREAFFAALDRKPLPGLVPHFELAFYLTMEAFGIIHPEQRYFHQWGQMSKKEQQQHRVQIAEVYIKIAEHYGHSAIVIRGGYPNRHQPVNAPDSPEEETLELRYIVDIIRDKTGDRYCLMTHQQHTDPTYTIPDGQGMEDLSIKMLDEPDAVKAHSEAELQNSIKCAEVLAKHGGLDGFALCCDYCFNSGSFLPLDWFDNFITPYLKRVIKAYRDMGFYTIKHTDGNIMPILDRLLDANPHAIHSLDPQGNIDIAEMVKVAGDRVALCGNVNAGLIQTGTDEQVIESARYALENGMKAPGYIFSTSNSVYTGMPLERYELIHRVWQEYGIRK